MKELEALKAALIKLYGEIPSEIADELAAIEVMLTPAPEAPATTTPENA